MIFLLVITVIITLSCGNEPPIVKSPIFSVLVFQKESLNMYKDSLFLSLYFIMIDDNGEEDLHEVRITHIDSEYSWLLSPEQLSKVVWGDDTYFGFSYLEYNNSDSVLLGDYLITVEDKAGNMTDQMVTVEVPNYRAPEFVIDNIPYVVEANEKGDEIKIKNGAYSSCEIKLLNNPQLFNNSRKKYKQDEKIVIETAEDQKNQRILSVRVNSDDSETLVYFLKNFRF